LRHAFGSWPPPEFNRLSDEQVSSFWNSIKTTNGKDLQKVADETLQRFRESGESYAFGGTFEPLAFWATQGYDVQRIKDLTPDCDKEEHPILGTTYRIHKHSTNVWGNKGDRWAHAVGGTHGGGTRCIEDKRAQPLRVRSKRIKAICDGVTEELGEDAVEDEADEGDGPSQSSSGSSTSSSSSRHKKSKKSKKKKHDKKKKKHDKKAKKEKAKERARVADEKKQKKIEGQTVKVAQMLIVKIDPTQRRLAELTGSANFLHMPPMICDSIKDWTTTFQKIAQDANKVLKEGVKPTTALPDMKDTYSHSLSFRSVSIARRPCRLQARHGYGTNVSPQK
jgi:hypothetical protein